MKNEIIKVVKESKSLSFMYIPGGCGGSWSWRSSNPAEHSAMEASVGNESKWLDPSPGDPTRNPSNVSSSISSVGMKVLLRTTNPAVSEFNLTSFPLSTMSFWLGILLGGAVVAVTTTGYEEEVGLEVECSDSAGFAVGGCCSMKKLFMCWMKFRSSST